MQITTLDLIKSGQRLADAVVIMEASAVITRYPDTHAIIAQKLNAKNKRGVHILTLLSIVLINTYKNEYQKDYRPLVYKELDTYVLVDGIKG